MSVKRASTAGITLLETLLVLATIALILGLSIQQFGLLKSSPTAQILADIQAQVDAKKRAAFAQFQTIRVAHETVLSDNATLCSPPDLWIEFHKDGTVGAIPFCVSIDGSDHQIHIDWITGKVRMDAK